MIVAGILQLLFVNLPGEDVAEKNWAHADAV
jgi:hypothetical protein